MSRNHISKQQTTYKVKPKMPVELRNALHELADWAIRLTYKVSVIDVNKFFDSESLQHLWHLIDQVDYVVDVIAYDIREEDPALYETIKGIYPFTYTQLTSAREKLERGEDPVKVKADIILTLNVISSVILYILVRW